MADPQKKNSDTALQDAVIRRYRAEYGLDASEALTQDQTREVQNRIVEAKSDVLEESRNELLDGNSSAAQAYRNVVLGTERNDAKLAEYRAALDALVERKTLLWAEAMDEKTGQM